MVPCGHAHLHLMSRHDIAVLRRCCASIAVYMLSELRVPFQKHLSPSLYYLFFLLHDGALGFIPTPPRWAQSENDPPDVWKHECHATSCGTLGNNLPEIGRSELK